MHSSRDSVILCRCFEAERFPGPRDRDGHPSSAVSEAAVRSESPFLRPGVDCMQRWIDLNA